MLLFAVLEIVFGEHPLEVCECIENIKLCLKAVDAEIAPGVKINVTMVELSDEKLGKIITDQGFHWIRCNYFS